MENKIKLIEHMEMGKIDKQDRISVINTMKRMPLGHELTIIVSGDYLHGEYYVKVYKKITSDHVKLIDEGMRG